MSWLPVGRSSIVCIFWVLFRFFVVEGLQEKVWKEYSVTSTLCMRKRYESNWKPASSWTMAYSQRMCVFPLSISFYLLIPPVTFLICIKQINTDDNLKFKICISILHLLWTISVALITIWSANCKFIHFTIFIHIVCFYTIKLASISIT